MRMVMWAALGVVIAAVSAGTANAGVDNQWGAKDFYFFGPGDLHTVNYTILPDGVTYRWDFAVTSEDPNATLTLSGPNQRYTMKRFMTADGPSPWSGFVYYGVEGYTFEEYYRGPGLVSYLVSGPATWDICDQNLPVGSVCAETYQIWGNAAFMQATSQNYPVTAHLTITAVPEPAAWALMILGFGLAGAVLRRRRLATAC